MRLRNRVYQISRPRVSAAIVLNASSLCEHHQPQKMAELFDVQRKKIAPVNEELVYRCYRCGR